MAPADGGPELSSCPQGLLPASRGARGAEEQVRDVRSSTGREPAMDGHEGLMSIIRPVTVHGGQTCRVRERRACTGGAHGGKDTLQAGKAQTHVLGVASSTAVTGSGDRGPGNIFSKLGFYSRMLQKGTALK